MWQHGELEHLALIEKCVGLFPSSMIRRSKYEEDFFSRCVWLSIYSDLLLSLYMYNSFLVTVCMCVNLFGTSVLPRGGVVKTHSLSKDSQKFVSDMSSLQVRGFVFV